MCYFMNNLVDVHACFKIVFECCLLQFVVGTDSCPCMWNDEVTKDVNIRSAALNTINFIFEG